MSKSIKVGLAAATLLGATILPLQVRAACFNTHGKITNNAQADSSSLGVAALKIGSDKFECAVSGIPQAMVPEGPNFRHTLVCDDHVSAEEPQSQITLNSFFTAPPSPTGTCPAGNPFGPVSFSFEELSIPDPATARGLFVGIDPARSAVKISGNYNCNGGITMKLKGAICFPD